MVASAPFAVADNIVGTALQGNKSKLQGHKSSDNELAEALNRSAEAAAVVGPALVVVGASASLAAGEIAMIAVAAVSETPTRYPEQT